MARFKLQNILEMHLRNYFEDAFLEYFNVNWDLGAPKDTSPESRDI